VGQRFSMAASGSKHRALQFIYLSDFASRSVRLNMTIATCQYHNRRVLDFLFQSKKYRKFYVLVLRFVILLFTGLSSAQFGWDFLIAICNKWLSRRGHLCTVTMTVTNVTLECQVTRRQHRQEGTKNEYLRDVESSTNVLGNKLGLPGANSES